LRRRTFLRVRSRLKLAFETALVPQGDICRLRHSVELVPYRSESLLSRDPLRLLFLEKPVEALACGHRRLPLTPSLGGVVSCFGGSDISRVVDVRCCRGRCFCAVLALGDLGL
jgi:hypothetical protein